MYILKVRVGRTCFVQIVHRCIVENPMHEHSLNGRVVDRYWAFQWPSEQDLRAWLIRQMRATHSDQSLKFLEPLPCRQWCWGRMEWCYRFPEWHNNYVLYYHFRKGWQVSPVVDFLFLVENQDCKPGLDCHWFCPVGPMVHTLGDQFLSSL